MMADDEILRYDEDGAPLGDRVAASGWGLPRRVRIVKADASGITAFANGTTAYGPPHTKVNVVIDGRPIESRQVVLDDDYLVAEGPLVGVVEPRRALLDAFLRLALDPSDGAIADYAGRYGMLGLRPRELVPADAVLAHVPWVGELLAPHIGYQSAPGTSREALGLWRRVLGEVAAVYAIAGHLRRAEPVEQAAWERLIGIAELPFDPTVVVDDDTAAIAIARRPSVRTAPTILVSPTTVEGQRQALAAVLGAWLALGAVRPAIAWGGLGQRDPLITLGAATLFGGLVLELLVAVGGQAGFAICSGCGLPYVPRRRPPAGALGAPRAAFCPTCREAKVAQKFASHRWRMDHPDYSKNRRAEARRKAGHAGSATQDGSAGPVDP